MGNCLKIVTNSDDISLLREGSSSRRDTISDFFSELPPSYQESSDHLQGHPLQQSSRSHHQSIQSNNNPYASNSVNSSTTASMGEDEQIRTAQRLGLIQHLPSGSYDGSKKSRECVICMNEFIVGDMVRYLPCLHIYHTVCIDDWLMRGSFTCPSCMEPVDAALLSTYQTDWIWIRECRQHYCKDWPNELQELLYRSEWDTERIDYLMHFSVCIFSSFWKEVREKAIISEYVIITSTVTFIYDYVMTHEFIQQQTKIPILETLKFFSSLQQN
jgi:E3 ubiquitin-protein ligase RNF11